MTIRNNLYQNDIHLMFDSFKHQYKEGNEIIPSVTGILSIISKPALVAWAANSAIDYVQTAITPGKSYDELELNAIFEAGRKNHYQKKTDAGAVGTILHHWIDQYIKGLNPATPVNQKLKEAVDQFLAWVKKHKVEFMLSEQMIFSKKFRYTGTLDFICKIDGELYIGDLKTSSGIYNEMLIQTAAYRYAREEEFPEEKYKGQIIVRIGKEGDFELAVVRDEDTYARMFLGFLSALKLYQTMAVLKEYKPEEE